MDSITGNSWTDAALAALLGAGAFAIGKRRASRKLLKAFHGSAEYKKLADEVFNTRKAYSSAWAAHDKLSDAVAEKWKKLIPSDKHYRGHGIYESAPKYFEKGELTHPIDVLKNKKNIGILYPVDHGAARYRLEAIPDLEEEWELARSASKKRAPMEAAEAALEKLEGKVLPEISSKAKKTGLIAGGATAGSVGIVSAGLKSHDTLSKEPPPPSPAPLPAVKPEAPKPTPASKKEAPKLTARDVLSYAGTQAILGALIGGFFKPSGSGVGGLLGTATGGSLGAFGGKYLGDYLSKKFNTHGDAKDIVQFGTPYITALLGAALARQLVKRKKEENNV